MILVRSGDMDGQPFQVLLQPPGRPGTSSELTAPQQDYWTSVAFTRADPDWAAEPA